MNIIFSSFDDIKNPYYGGGGALSIHEIAKRLAKNHKIIVITGKYPGSKDEMIDGIEYKRIGFLGGHPKLAQILFQFMLPYHVIKLKHDIWIESFTPPFSTAFLQWFTKRPVIGYTQLLAGENMSKKYHLPFKIIERLGLKTYKNFIVLTNELNEKIKLYNKNARTEVIPNGINESLINAVITEKPDDYILYLGRIDRKQKGLDLLLEAYNQVKESISLPLVIAGNGPKHEVDWMKSKITELGLTDKISLAGRVDGKEKIDLLKNSAFVVMPSRFEAMGIIALEAFALKSPLIIFDIPDLNWIPRDYTIRVPGFNTKLLGTELLKLSVNKKLRNEMGERAREFAVKYDWNKIVIQYESFIVNSRI